MWSRRSHSHTKKKQECNNFSCDSMRCCILSLLISISWFVGRFTFLIQLNYAHYFLFPAAKNAANKISFPCIDFHLKTDVGCVWITHMCHKKQLKLIISTKDSSRAQYCMAIATLKLAVQSIAAKFVEWPAAMHSSWEKHHEHWRADFRAVAEDSLRCHDQCKWARRTDIRSGRSCNFKINFNSFSTLQRAHLSQRSNWRLQTVLTALWQ